jgi:photosystem II stability/assembly factor-like uncharacterized protein
MVGNWYQQFMPNIGSKQITDITFLDSLTGFAVASRNINPDTSSILRTTDGGDSWQIIFAQAQRRFSRIKFINSLTGFISGGSGSGTPYLYKSIDGGNNWLIIPGATLGTAFWKDMAVLNEDTLWLVDDNSLNGGVFFTSNGGANWQNQFSAGSQNPEKIYMFNARIGFISDNSGSSSIRKTTNGGLNWNVNVSGRFFFDMQFVDSLTGWYSHGSNVYKTTDGGNSWITQILPTGGIILTSNISSFSILSRDTIWGAGGQLFYGGGRFRAMLFRTTNGGDNWLFQIPDTSYGIPALGYIQFMNKNFGWSYNSFNGIHTITGGNDTFFTPVKVISTKIPKEFFLYQNYPNPFNPKTIIRFQIIRLSDVKLNVYDISGKEIITLVNEEKSAGTYEVDFNGSNYSSGIYFYSLLLNNRIQDTRKMVLVK